jgi:hypothetical protein
MRYRASTRCVCASGNPLPAPWRTFATEEHAGETWVEAGETQEIDLACTDFGPGSSFDGAWPVDVTVDVSLHDQEPGDPVDDSNDPLNDPWQ